MVGAWLAVPLFYLFYALYIITADFVTAADNFITSRRLLKINVYYTHEVFSFCVLER